MQSVIQELVDRLHAVVNERDPSGSIDQVPDYSNAFWAEAAHKEYRLRRLRSKVFETEDLFGEPAWDLMLDLFSRQMQGQQTSITSACLASCVPSTTALRWISILEKSQLVEKFDDPADGRRAFLRMTRKGLERMKQFILQGRRIPAMKL